MNNEVDDTEIELAKNYEVNLKDANDPRINTEITLTRARSKVSEAFARENDQTIFRNVQLDGNILVLDEGVNL